MKSIRHFFLTTILLVIYISANAQKARIEQAKFIRVDSRLITISGYLVVPENRQHPDGNAVKIPFVFVRRPDQSATRNVSLYTTGGPGYSTTANIDSISYNSGFLKYGGFIAFDQRGTKRAVPCLDCEEVNKAIQKSYLEGKDRDSLVKKATLECRERLAAKGINLSSYTTLESAADINDLRLVLGLDSLNLVGISYSGGLMLTVAKLYPATVSKIVLNSPLPSFVSYEDRALTNINEALEQVFANCSADSSAVYKNIRERFQNYFSALKDNCAKPFALRYLLKGQTDSIVISYGKSELLDLVVDRLNTQEVKGLPKVILELIDGQHKNYITNYFNGVFSGASSLSLGMRYSVYCSEQIAYASQSKLEQEQKAYPWLKGFRFNNVDKALCDCWKVRSEPKHIRQAAVTSIPILISAGDIDPWTRPYYNALIKKTMLGAKLLIFHNRGHGPGFTINNTNYLDLFMVNPRGKLVSVSSDLLVQ